MTAVVRPMTSVRTVDESRVAFYAPTKLGPNQSMTPEGFLLCKDVPIARTGELLYTADEVPVEAGRDGIVRIRRDEDEVFKPETMASFLGKPVTLDHPEESVTPSNWKEHSVGVIAAVRRGEDAFDRDYLLADLLIQDVAAIHEIQKNGLREVSCGYDADYEQIEPGLGKQHNILGNHLALVERGRCGPRCAIGDKETKPMVVKRTWKDRLLTAFKANDEAAMLEELEGLPQELKAPDESEPQRVVIEIKQPDSAASETVKDDGEEEPSDPLAQIMAALAAINARLDKIEAAEAVETGDDGEETEKKDEDDEGKTADEEPDDKKDDEGERKPTGDSAGLVSEFNDTKAKAEILAPGIKFPTFDAKADPKKTADNLCALRRKALATAFKDDGNRAFVQQVMTGDSADFAKMACGEVKAIFNGSTALAKSANNARVTRDSKNPTAMSGNSIADINRRNRDFYGQK